MVQVRILNFFIGYFLIFGWFFVWLSLVPPIKKMGDILPLYFRGVTFRVTL